MCQRTVPALAPKFLSLIGHGDSASAHTAKDLSVISPCVRVPHSELLGLNIINWMSPCVFTDGISSRSHGVPYASLVILKLHLDNSLKFYRHGRYKDFLELLAQHSLLRVLYLNHYVRFMPKFAHLRYLRADSAPYGGSGYQSMIQNDSGPNANQFPQLETGAFTIYEKYRHYYVNAQSQHICPLFANCKRLCAIFEVAEAYSLVVKNGELSSLIVSVVDYIVMLKRAGQLARLNRLDIMFEIKYKMNPTLTRANVEASLTDCISPQTIDLMNTALGSTTTSFAWYTDAFISVWKDELFKTRDLVRLCETWINS